MSQRQHHYLIGSDIPIVYSEQPKHGWSSKEFSQFPVHRRRLYFLSVLLWSSSPASDFQAPIWGSTNAERGEKRKVGRQATEGRKTGSEDRVQKASRGEKQQGGWGKDKVR